MLMQDAQVKREGNVKSDTPLDSCRFDVAGPCK